MSDSPEDEEVPVVAIAQAVRAGVVPTLGEWLGLSAPVRDRWAREADGHALARAADIASALLGELRTALERQAVAQAFEDAHAAAVAEEAPR